MSVTSGFFNSLNHDRRYNAQQFSAIFDGIINDGVFANIGVAFAITVDSGVTINIGEGKAWFNSAWVYNDALLPKTLEGSEVVLDRIDAVVIEVDHSESVRMGDIKIVKGTPSSSPKNPTMANTTNKHQYPLAYIYRKAGSTVITQADITNMVGTSSCPYITGILQVQNIDNIVAQWNAQWNQWYAEKIAETDTDASELMAEMKSEFDIWFADVQALLEDDVATALAAEVAALQSKFDDLARDGCVYDVIEDSDLDVILGSDGTPLQGKTVCRGGGDVDTSGLATKDEFNNLEAEFNNLEAEFNNLESEFNNAVYELNESKLSMVLLRENEKPTEGMGPTFFNMPELENFDFVDIELRLNTSTNYYVTFRIAVGTSGNCITDNNNGKLISRIISASTDKLNVGGGYVYNSYGVYTANNGVLIPRRIFGVKGGSLHG